MTRCTPARHRTPHRISINGRPRENRTRPASRDEPADRQPAPADSHRPCSDHAHHGFADRFRLLLARGVDPEERGSRRPIYEGRSPVQEAALSRHMDVVSVLVDAGASSERDEVDTLLAMATAGDRDAVDLLLVADPGLRERVIERHPDQLVRAAEKNSLEAVARLIELGFDVNAVKRTAPLHEAAMRGNLAVIELLLEHGADPNVRDVGYKATLAGWAEHFGQTEAERLLAALEDRS